MTGKSPTSIRAAMTDMRESVRQAHREVSETVMGPKKDADRKFFDNLTEDDFDRLRGIFGGDEVDRYIQAMTGG